MIRTALAAEYALKLGRQDQVIMVFAWILRGYTGNVHGIYVHMHAFIIPCCSGISIDADVSF